MALTQHYHRSQRQSRFCNHNPQDGVGNGKRLYKLNGMLTADRRCDHPQPATSLACWPRLICGTPNGSPTIWPVTLFYVSCLVHLVHRVPTLHAEHRV